MRFMFDILIWWLRKGMEWSQRRPNAKTPMPSSSQEVLLRCLYNTFCYSDLYAQDSSHSALVAMVHTCISPATVLLLKFVYTYHQT